MQLGSALGDLAQTQLKLCRNHAKMEKTSFVSEPQGNGANCIKTVERTRDTKPEEKFGIDSQSTQPFVDECHTLVGRVSVWVTLEDFCVFTVGKL